LDPGKKRRVKGNAQDEKKKRKRNNMFEHLPWLGFLPQGLCVTVSLNCLPIAGLMAN